MVKPERGLVQRPLEVLREAVARSHAASNAALAASAQEKTPPSPTSTPFSYRLPDAQHDATLHTIPPEQFKRQYALCLESLSVTVYGYCIERQFGWERRLEPALVLRRPAWWRRLLRAAPLLALTVQSHPAGAEISIAAAKKPDYRGKINCIVRLEPALQQQLKKIHQHQTIAASFKNKIVKIFSLLKK